MPDDKYKEYEIAIKIGDHKKEKKLFYRYAIIQYIRTSGTGTLNTYVSAKRI